MNENKGVPAAVGTLFYRQYHQIAVIFLQSGENLRIFEKNSEKHLIFAKNRDIIFYDDSKPKDRKHSGL